MDNLEQFIQNNRQEFDNESPNPLVWAKIQGAIAPEQQKPKPIYKMWVTRAAAAAILVLIGVGLGRSYQTSEPASIWASELADIEHHYNGELLEKRKVLTSLGHQDPLLEQDLQRIEETLIELKREFDQTPEAGRGEIIHALIQNYKARISLLERVLKHINNLENKENNHYHEQDEIDI